MPDLLLYGDTQRSAALRHELPISIPDPFLYAEVGGQAYVMCTFLESTQIAEVRPDATLLDVDELGFHELLGSGLTREELWLELTARAAAATGVREAIVDFEFALGVAERLRADGIGLTVNEELFSLRRRVKTAQEMAGIRRAQRAAEAGMAAAAALLRRAESIDGILHVDGTPLLAEQVRDALRDACAEHGAPAPPSVIVASVKQGAGHESGTGPLPAALPHPDRSLAAGRGVRVLGRHDANVRRRRRAARGGAPAGAARARGDRGGAGDDRSRSQRPGAV